MPSCTTAAFCNDKHQADIMPRTVPARLPKLLGHDSVQSYRWQGLLQSSLADSLTCLRLLASRAAKDAGLAAAGGLQAVRSQAVAVRLLPGASTLLQQEVCPHDGSVSCTISGAAALLGPAAPVGQARLFSSLLPPEVAPRHICMEVKQSEA